MLEPLVVPAEAPKPKPARLASLDVLRGFTVLLMVFVDEIGGAFPHINHSPWNNVTLADFVMPWFLFMVGTSLSISLRKYRAARDVGTKIVVVRGLKLFFLGVLLQGGLKPMLDGRAATFSMQGLLHDLAVAGCSCKK